MEVRLYHIAAHAEWEQAQAAGVYRAASLDAEGFIHLSRRDQVLRVANTFYAGQTGLLLLVIDPARVEAEIRHEAPSPAPPQGAPPGETFPHLYGPLPVEAVVAVHDFVPDAAGEFSFPS